MKAGELTGLLFELVAEPKRAFEVHPCPDVPVADRGPIKGRRDCGHGEPAWPALTNGETGTVEGDALAGRDGLTSKHDSAHRAAGHDRNDGMEPERFAAHGAEVGQPSSTSALGSGSCDDSSDRSA